MERANRWLGFPRGAWLIIGVEFWERFSFYGMLAILSLFLTDSPANGGFGWSAAQALLLVGAYSGSMYAFPALGGFLADRVLGRRRAVAIGASFMLVGQILMTSPTFLPMLFGARHHTPLLDALHMLGVPLGQIIHSPATAAAIASHGESLDTRFGAIWLDHAYTAGTLGFYGALLCLIVGNALMKSTLVVLCGETFEAGDPRREGAYAYYYLGISVGAMLSGIIVGVVSESIGWHYGFAVTAAGMSVALCMYLVLAPRWLKSIGVRPASRSDRVSAGMRRLSSDVQWRIYLLLVLAALLCLFSIGWFQIYGSWSLFIERLVDRSIGSLTIPVPWFSSINAAVVILVAPVVARLWVHFAERNRSVDIMRKYAFALAMAALAHFLMYVSTIGATTGAKAVVWIPILAVALLAIGEIVAWTATYGVVSRAAPPGFESMTMGAWYLLTLGLGGYLAGFTGSFVDTWGFSTTFGAICAVMGSAMTAALCLRRPLLRLAERAGVDL